MDPSSSNSQGVLAAWDVQAFRLSAFPSSQIEPRTLTWFTDASGSPPERTVSKPREGTIQEDAPHRSGRLSLSVAPVRIDWVNAPDPSQAAQQPGFSGLGPFFESLPSFTDVAAKWLALETLPPIQRLAFGAVLIHQAGTPEEAFSFLTPLLPAVKVPPIAQDFIFQLNRRRPSPVGPENLQINRLAKWSVVFMTEQLVTLAPFSVVPSRTSDRFGVSLELDINTWAEFRGTFEPPSLASLFGVLVEMGEEIAAKGDIP